MTRNERKRDRILRGIMAAAALLLIGLCLVGAAACRARTSQETPAPESKDQTPILAAAIPAAEPQEPADPLAELRSMSNVVEGCWITGYAAGADRRMERGVSGLPGALPYRLRGLVRSGVYGGNRPGGNPHRGYGDHRRAHLCGRRPWRGGKRGGYHDVAGGGDGVRRVADGRVLDDGGGGGK